ncbi:hypothetical protein EF888_07125 [Silicimonas algicola]|uniref:Uncharacterized protein n=1 Tax=Silicimonas algicola TaxID=1826607 RepID=A0A316G3D8_9RHOB|nr:hypothetical protein [Silicimonas algicola]AZQ66931.1 hypothetical protein EF888_07125 [Silicimonas algicola]PWK55153.1 hypothetical protein C8D95_10828 [Silicimonas algicola]
MTKTLNECRVAATHLAGLIEGLALMHNETNAKIWGDAIVSTTEIAAKLSKELMIDLDIVKGDHAMTENTYPRAEDDAERALYDIECLCRVGVAASNTTLDADSLLFSMDTL